MRLLFRDPEAGQKVNDGLSLDFELAGQLVDSDLIGVGHALRSIQLMLQKTTNSFRWTFLLPVFRRRRQLLLQSKLPKKHQPGLQPAAPFGRPR